MKLAYQKVGKKGQISYGATEKWKQNLKEVKLKIWIEKNVISPIRYAK